MVQYKTGNLLTADVDFICHQVNCQGRMASGIAKGIREKWPEVYAAYMDWHKANGHTIYNNILIVPVENNQSVVNMASQYSYGYDGKRYTSYDAFWECLNRIAQTVPKRSKIGFPYRIGCGLGGANWPVIETMIYMVLGKDFDVYIYCLEDEKHD